MVSLNTHTVQINRLLLLSNSKEEDDEADVFSVHRAQAERPKSEEEDRLNRRLLRIYCKKERDRGGGGISARQGGKKRY